MGDIDDCEIHGCSTELRELRVGDPIKPSLKQTPAYLWAKRAQFPYSDDVVDGRGIRRTAQTARVPVCAECCAQRDRFLLARYPIWSRTHELAS
jgi:hypothetical protein